MAELLKKYLEVGVIDVGHKDEIVMHLLRKAYMDAIITEQEAKDGTSPNFSKGCTFVGFLKALFAQCFHGLVLQCRPDNKVTSHSALEDTFKDAIVRFTHSIKAADSSALTTRGMAMTFLRGAAIMGHNTQFKESVDVAIPILLHKDHMIEEESMSIFLVRVEQRHHSGTVDAYNIDVNEFGFFQEGSTGDVRPYVTLVAKLGVEGPPCEADDMAASQSGTCASACQASKPVEAHPRYSIRTYECTPEAWKVICPNERDCYEKILSTDALLASHPRQDEATLQLVWGMMPFCSGHAARFSDGKPRPVRQRHKPVEVGFYEDSESTLEKLSRHLDWESDLSAFSPLTGSEESGSEDGMVVDENV